MVGGVSEPAAMAFAANTRLIQVPGVQRRLLLVGLLVVLSLAGSILHGGVGGGFQAHPTSFANTQLNTTPSDLSWRDQIRPRLTAIGLPRQVVATPSAPDPLPVGGEVADDRNPNIATIAQPRTSARPWAVKAATARAPPNDLGAA